MTMTFRTDDFAARRQAALERLRGGAGPGTAPDRRARAKVALRRRPRPVRQHTRTRQVVMPERLPPPPTVYYAIAVIVAMFVMLGLVMVLSATSAAGVGSSDSPYSAFQRQFAWAVIGAVLMAVAMKVPYPRWRSLVVPGMILASVGILLPFVPGLGARINDASSWVRIGGFGFQPSELMKVAAIAFLAWYLSDRADSIHDPRVGILPVAGVLAWSAGICLAQGDMGSAGVLAASILVVALIAGVPFLHVSMVSLVGAAGVAAIIIGDPRRLARFTAFQDIEGSRYHSGYQVWQSLLSIANGGLTGSGIGGSTSKLGYLPLAHSDFIFAVVADELGLVGSVAVIGGFALLVWFGIQTALAAPDTFGMLLASGISTWFAIQAIINLGGVAAVIPVTGITLPFFSAGGTSLVTSMIAAGLLLNVARRARTSERPRRRSLRAWIGR